MDKKHSHGPPANAGKRRHIDRLALIDALEQRLDRDARDPPASLLTTMGAVRMLADLIIDRREGRGWTDPMLVVLLREMGIEISAETLRVYRARLNKERERSSGVAPTPPDAPLSHPRAPDRPIAKPKDTVRSNDEAEIVIAPAKAGNDTSTANFDRSVPFDDRV